MQAIHLLPARLSAMLRLLLICMGLSLIGLNIQAESTPSQDSSRANASSDFFNGSNKTLPANNSSALKNTANFLGTQSDFLPVDQAYVFTATIENNTLVLHWEIAPDYYLYRERFTYKHGEAILAPEYSDALLKYDELFERETLLHFNEAYARIPLSQLEDNQTLTISYQGCAAAGLCYPPERRHLNIDKATQTVAIVKAPISKSTTNNAAQENPSSAASFTWWYAAFFALLGGIILNIMPCVFPVLSIKILALTQTDRAHLPKHGIAYTAGVLASFAILAFVLIGLKATGNALGWGFQLQSPPAIALLFLLFLVMGLALSGAINLGSNLMGLGDKFTRETGVKSSFATGVLAAVVASPCTAPFMGAAIGYAITQSIGITLLVFLALGFGMALPLLLLCLFPQWLALLPKPGRWMETAKELFAFPLYLSAIWLLWVYGRQTDVSAMSLLLIAGLAVAFGLWLLSRHVSSKAKWLLNILTLACFVFAIVTAFNTKTGASVKKADGFWQEYSSATLAELRAKGTPVFINLTADWCITCLANEKAVLNLEETKDLFNSQNIVALKGDWTNVNPEITQLLEEYGRSGIPLYLWFPANHEGKGIILPQILTKSSLYEKIKANN